MPGTNLNLDLPSLSDSLATIVSKLVTALSAIQTDLTPKITASEINVNAALSFNGNALTGLGSATLVSGNVPTAAGSIYYSSGEFYAIDATGTVKLTNLGQIAVAGVKGIGGDYGSVSNGALVYYDNTSGEYRFFNGTGTAPGDLVAGYVTMSNGTNYTRLQPNAGLGSSYTITFPSGIPATANSVMAFSAANPTVASFQSPATFVRTSAALPGYSTAAPITMNIALASAIPTTATSPWTYTNMAWVGTVATAGIDIPVTLPAGAIVTGWAVYINKATANTCTVLANLLSLDTAGSTGTPGSVQSNAGNSDGVHTLQQTGMSLTIAATKQYVLNVQKTSAATGDSVYLATVTYYIP